MKGELKRKTTRTVHGKKVVRLRIDVPYGQLKRVGDIDQDANKWLDNRVGGDIDFALSLFEDEDQSSIDEMMDMDL